MHIEEKGNGQRWLESERYMLVKEEKKKLSDTVVALQSNCHCGFTKNK